MSNDLDNTIKSHNPFEGRLVVKSQDIWGKGFPDVPSLNAHASDAVFEAIDKVRSRKTPVVGITITAEKGLGKTHIISRIRHRLQADGSALFVYMNEWGDLNKIKPAFLNTLATSLKQIGSQGVSQWRELATALVNEALNKNYPPQQIVSQFPGVLAKNPKLVDMLRDKILGIKSDIENPDILTAILWTLSPDPGYEVYAINWLSGNSLPQSKADAMGLANISFEDKEAESFKTVVQVLDLISHYKPIIICFDEVDGTDCNDVGFTKAQVAASLAKDLYNTMKRGILLTAMYPETWVQQVKTLPYAEAVTDRISEKFLELKYPNSDDVVALVSGWLQDFYEERGLTPPHPVYPFEEAKLRALGKEKPIVRKVLKWCAENFSVNPVTSVEANYNKELEALDSTIEDLMENKATLAEALRLGFLAIKGETVENVKIADIAEVKANAADRGYIDFKIIGTETGKDVKIGVAVLQDSGGSIIKATLKRLIDYEKFDLTRGCLVRSKQINKGAAKAQEYLTTLLSSELGGEWVLLKAEDIKPLLAIHFLMKGREDYELTEQQILDFVVQRQIAIDNYLIREILSDPSGQIPEDAIDEDSDNGSNLNVPVTSDLVEVGVDIF
jgi:hypothetical protein